MTNCQSFNYFIFSLAICLFCTSIPLKSVASDNSFISYSSIDSNKIIFSALGQEEYAHPIFTPVKQKIQQWALKQLQKESVQNREKLNAILLAIAMGPFGVHRLYLGTHPRVPVIYTLTLGGGLGILPLVDIIAILTTRDLSKFKDNERIIMWAN